MDSAACLEHTKRPFLWLQEQGMEGIAEVEGDQSHEARANPILQHLQSTVHKVQDAWVNNAFSDLASSISTTSSEVGNQSCCCLFPIVELLSKV